MCDPASRLPISIIHYIPVVRIGEDEPSPNCSDSPRGADLSANMDPGLIDAVLNGPLSQQSELLPRVSKLSAENQRELLKLAVRSGRLEVVAWLLGKGIDPTISDGGESSALQEAELLEARFVDDDSRKNISKLLRFVRDKNAESPSSSVMGKETNVVNSINLDLQQSLAALSMLTRDVSLLGESLKKLTNGVTSLQDGLANHHFGVKKELEQVNLSVQKSVEELRGSMVLRDGVLKKLETQISTLTEEVLPLCEFLKAVRSKAAESPQMESDLRDILGDGNCQERVRDSCVKELIRRTELLKRSSENASSTMEMYKKLYDTSPLTRCILRYLRLKTEVQFVIDFDSYYIGDVKNTVRDLAGKERRGSSLYTFADMVGLVVYLGGKVGSSWSTERVIGQFVMSLAQICFSLEYHNCGRPYAADDDVSRDKLSKAVEELKGSWSVEDNYFDDSVKEWVGSSSELEKHVCLVASVPGMVATFGTEDGILRARRKMRGLVKFYEGLVMPRLQRALENH